MGYMIYINSYDTVTGKLNSYFEDTTTYSFHRAPAVAQQGGRLMSRFTFPVGYHDIHRIKIVNYQLNRWHSLGYCRFEDLKAAALRMR